MELPVRKFLTRCLCTLAAAALVLVPLVGCDDRGAANRQAISGQWEGRAPQAESPATSPAGSGEIPADADPGPAAAEQFLSQFVSVFQRHKGWRDLATGDFYVKNMDTWQWITTDNQPLVFIGGNRDDFDFLHFSFDGRTFFDRDGNEIFAAPYIWLSALATSFSLYDLDGGAPTIVVRFTYWDTSDFGFAASQIVYRFVDGRYVEVGTLHSPLHTYRFYRDTNGQLIIHYNDELHDIVGYYYVTLGGNQMHFEPVGGTPAGPLTAIPPMTQLQDRMAASIRQQLGLN